MLASGNAPRDPALFAQVGAPLTHIFPAFPSRRACSVSGPLCLALAGLTCREILPLDGAALLRAWHIIRGLGGADDRGQLGLPRR